jgi:FkbM family methyltransferase
VDVVRPLKLLPLDLGRVRLANYVYRRKFSNAQAPLRATRLTDGSRFALDLADWPQAQAFLLGEYDASTVRFVTEHLARDGVFIDAGAHVGLISFQVLRRVPSASIHAFDPHPERAEQFARHIALNNAEDQVHLNVVGLSDTGEPLGFDFSRHAVAASATTISTVRLDDYLEEHAIDRVDVIKLDVEGHELQALSGASRFLADRRIRAITLEAMESHGSIHGAAGLLTRYGYRRIPLASSSIALLRRNLGVGRRVSNVAYVATDQ